MLNDPAHDQLLLHPIRPRRQAPAETACIPWCVVPEYAGRRNLVFSWFWFNRSKPRLDPNRVVPGFSLLDDLKKRLTERFVDELLLPDEAAELRRHLKENHGLDVNLAPFRPGERTRLPWTGYVPTGMNIRIHREPPFSSGGRDFSFAAHYDPAFTLKRMAAACLDALCRRVG